MDVRLATNPEQIAGMDTRELREHYLVEQVFGTDEVRLLYSHEDRLVVGGVRLTGESRARLETADPLRSEYFLQRRELGVVNVGAEAGTVTVDGTGYPLGRKDVLYVGRGARDVSFSGTGATFYLVSAPAHTTYPTVAATLADASPVHLGDPASSNVRTINKFVHADGIQSCQLVMGITELGEGSMWNTMPAHTHERRTEIYLYLDLAADQRVVHLMGRPEETRHLVVAGEQAVISPAWSVHCGFGTSSYSFVWAMAGENVNYTDVESFPITELR